MLGDLLNDGAGPVDGCGRLVVMTELSVGQRERRFQLPGHDRTGMQAKLSQRRLHEVNPFDELTACDCAPSEQAIGLCHVLPRFIVQSGVTQAACKVLGLVEITLFQPVLGETGLQTDVVSPPEPGVALEDVFDLTKDR